MNTRNTLTAMQPLAASDFLELYTQATSLVETARKMARSGEKDKARNWLNLLETCARLLVKVDFTRLQNAGWNIAPGLLVRQCDHLRTECHPANEPSFEGDLNRIERLLEDIARGVQTSIQMQSNSQGGAK